MPLPGMSAPVSRVERILRDAGGSVKILLVYPDGLKVESVLLEDRGGRRTACLSVQVGCAMGCLFCRTGTMGLVRDLTEEEIIEQFVHLSALCGGISNAVFMGMGEPLMNFPRVKAAAEILIHKLGLAPRRITVSTCGVVPGIKSLTESKLPVNLAVSLPTANKDLRRRLMPGAAVYSLESLWEILARYGKESRKRCTISVVLMNNVNDTEADAVSLASFLRGLDALVNLIPYNTVAGLGFREAGNEAVQAYYKILTERKIPAVRRYPRGGDIEGACGQLGNGQLQKAGAASVRRRP